MKKILFLGVILCCTFIINGCTSTTKTGTITETNTLHSENTLISVSTEKFKTLVDNKTDDTIILDVRTPEEFAEGHIAGAIVLDFYKTSFEEELDKLDKNLTYLIYCRSGNRSSNVLYTMKELKFKNVYDLDAGILEWKEMGYPLSTE